MSRSRKRAVLILAALALLAGLAVLWQMKPYRPFYTRQEVETYLEQRYDCDFTVNELVSEDRLHHQRVWRVTAEDYPDLTLYAQDIWYDGHWDSMFPVRYAPVHRLHDNCLSVSWNRWGTPLLAEYGVTADLSVPDSDPFGGVPTHREEAYRVCYTDDLDDVGARLEALLDELADLPFFRAVDVRFFIPVRMTVHEDVGFIYHEERFPVGRDYAPGEVAERLWGMRDYVVADLDRKFEGMGISPDLLDRFDPPAVSQDFFVTGDAFGPFSLQGPLDAAARDALFPGGTLYDWQTLQGASPLLDAPALYDYGTGEIDGRQYRCLSVQEIVSHREQTSGALYFLDEETGAVYQYGDFFLGSIEPEITGFLVDTGITASPEALAPQTSQTR